MENAQKPTNVNRVAHRFTRHVERRKRAIQMLIYHGVARRDDSYWLFTLSYIKRGLRLAPPTNTYYAPRNAWPEDR